MALLEFRGCGRFQPALLIRLRRLMRFGVLAGTLSGILLACSSATPYENRQQDTLKRLHDASDLARRGSRDADRAFQESCTAFLLLDDRENEIRCLLAYSNWKIKSGQSGQAHAMLDRAQLLSTQAKDHLRGEILAAQILLLIQEGRRDQAKALSEEALELSLGANIRKQLLAHRAYLYFVLPDAERALETFEKAAGSDDPELESYVQIHIARIELANGRWEKANQAALAALELDRTAGRSERVAFDYEILGGIAQGKGDRSQAREAYSRALDMYEALGDARKARRLNAALQSLQ